MNELLFPISVIAIIAIAEFVVRVWAIRRDRTEFETVAKQNSQFMAGVQVAVREIRDLQAKTMKSAVEIEKAWARYEAEKNLKGPSNAAN